MEEKKTINKGKWTREFDYDWSTNTFFTIYSDSYIVELTGGSIKVFKRKTKEELFRIKGYSYLYTGDIKPDESELFALENGKHFYVFSLKEAVQTKKVTLPRTYESIDLYGTYSKDGKSLFVPVAKYIDETEGYAYWICEYETEAYSLCGMKRVGAEDVPYWP